MTAGAYDIATEHAVLVEASAAGEWRTIPEAVIFGILLGVLYDIFRAAAAALGLRQSAVGERSLTARLRRVRCRPIKSKAAVTDTDDGETCGSRRRKGIPAQAIQFLLDILYFLLCGILGAVFLYWRSSGILRWYPMLGGLLGFWAYSRSVGVLMMRLTAFAAACVHALLCTAYNLLACYPLRILYRGLSALCARIGRLFARLRRKKQGKRKQTERKKQKRIGAIWQSKKNSQRKNQASSRRSRFLFLSDSAP